MSTNQVYFEVGDAEKSSASDQASCSSSFLDFSHAYNTGFVRAVSNVVISTINKLRCLFARITMELHSLLLQR